MCQQSVVTGPGMAHGQQACAHRCLSGYEAGHQLSGLLWAGTALGVSGNSFLIEYYPKAIVCWLKSTCCVVTRALGEGGHPCVLAEIMRHLPTCQGLGGCPFCHNPISPPQPVFITHYVLHIEDGSRTRYPVADLSRDVTFPFPPSQPPSSPCCPQRGLEDVSDAASSGT